MKRSILMLLVVAFCFCCQNSKMESSDAITVDIKNAMADQSPAPGPEVFVDPHAKLIKTADYRFRVSNLNKSTESIEGHVRNFPAHIESSNLSMEGNILESRMVIRVKSEFFYELLKEIDKEPSYVHHRNVRTEDVAKHFVDLESRLKTKREVQERYKNILRTKAGKIDELLAAEKQIGELQEEIEATISKLNYFKNQVAYSTINLEFYERLIHDNLAAEDDPTWKKFGDAFTGGLKGLVGILVGLTSIWPMLVIALITWLLLRNKKLLFRFGKS